MLTLERIIQILLPDKLVLRAALEILKSHDARLSADKDRELREHVIRVCGAAQRLYEVF